jgi:hypothetical protein
MQSAARNWNEPFLEHLLHKGSKVHDLNIPAQIILVPVDLTKKTTKTCSLT